MIARSTVEPHDPAILISFEPERCCWHILMMCISKRTIGSNIGDKSKTRHKNIPKMTPICSRYFFHELRNVKADLQTFQIKAGGMKLAPYIINYSSARSNYQN